MPTDVAPAEALELRESMYALSRDTTPFPEDLQEARVQRLVEGGTPLEEAQTIEASERAKLYPIHILRPCLGRGKGRHVYEAGMLQENASKFAGWRQYIDHLSPEARKKAAGLPRSIRDLAGRLVESYWDPTVPADEKKGYGQGAVVGWTLPTPFVRELIENDPELVEASISANATSVRPVNRGGQRAWLVEGIEDKGSVDYVTEGGAGGKVVALMEAAYGGEEDGMDLLEAMTDEDFIGYVQETRPHLLTDVEVEEAASNADDPDGGADEDTESDLEKQIEKMMARNPKLSRAQAEAMCKNSKKTMAEATHTQETDMGAITSEALQEALQDESFRGVLDTAVEERVNALVESKIGSERELIRAEARADADRQLELRDLRDAAHLQIAEAKLPDAFAAQVRNRFQITDTGPTPDLDVVDELADDGAVVKSAEDRLQEAVTTALSEQRDLLAAARPTRVTGQGPARSSKRGEGEGDPEPKRGDNTLYGSVLQEAGVDPSTAWDD